MSFVIFFYISFYYTAPVDEFQVSKFILFSLEVIRQRSVHIAPRFAKLPLAGTLSSAELLH